MSDVLEHVRLQFDTHLLQQTQQHKDLSKHNVGIISVIPRAIPEPCTASQSALGYATCMTITTSIEVSFNQGMSQCKIEYILLDDLSSLVETMFLDFEFDMTEFYPQVGLTKTQFLLEGVYCPPQEEEKSSFEGVVANYLVDALGASTAQPFLSVCVDVVDTEFIDEKMGDLSSSISTADVTGRSAPLPTTTGDGGISSFERKKSRPPRSREQYVPDTPSSKTVPNGATPGSSMKAEYHFLNQNDSGKAEDSSSGNEEMDVSPPRHVRPRGDGEGYYIADISTYDDAGETELAGEKAVMHTHHAPRPRRLDESSPTKAPSPGPTPTPHRKQVAVNAPSKISAPSCLTRSLLDDIEVQRLKWKKR